MQCEMCGSSVKLYKARVEGTVLTVCRGCSSCGEVIGPAAEPVLARKKEKKPSPAQPQKKEKQKELVLSINPDYGRLIKKKREKLGLKQAELARVLAEKESLVQKLEQGVFEPGIDLARKLERHLRISLVEQYEEESAQGYRGDRTVLTLGDLLAMKQKA